MFPRFMLFCCIITAACNGENGRESFRNYSVLRINPANEEQYKIILQLSKNEDVDFWTDPRSPDNSSRVMVPPNLRKILEKMLSVRKIKYSIVINDVQAVIDEERRKMKSRSSRVRRDDSISFFSTYHELDEIIDYMKRLNREHSKISFLKYIGRTYRKRKITLMKIGSVGETEKPAIWIDGCMHAREWISGSTALYIIHQLMTQYDSDESVRILVDHFDWYILPIANPDGYVYSRKTPQQRFWRKNRRPIPNTAYVGVDINRNFGYMWNTSTDERQRNPGSRIYQGPSPFSEEESKAINNFLNERKELLSLYLSLHSFGPYWLTPFGQRNTVPLNFDQMKSLAEIGNTAMKSHKGTTLPIFPLFQKKEVSGTSMDWARGTLNVSYSYTLEMDIEENHFETPVEKIVDFGHEIWFAVKAMALNLMKS